MKYIIFLSMFLIGCSKPVPPISVSSYIHLYARKIHNPSVTLAHTVQVRGKAVIPQTVMFIEGLGAYSGSPDGSAQLIFDGVTTCRYNMEPNKYFSPHVTGKPGIITNAATYHLIDCDKGYYAGDVVDVRHYVIFSLQSADISFKSNTVYMKLEVIK